MDSSSAASYLKTTVDLEKDQTSTTFFRRNKRLIFISFFLILLLALIITTSILIRMIIHHHTVEPVYLEIFGSHPAIECFCSVANNTPACIFSLNALVRSSSNIRPVDLYTVSLRESVKRLEELVPSLAENSDPETELVYSNCSSSLTDSMSQLNATLGILMETNPFGGRMRNDDPRDGMMNGIVGAEGNLGSCLDDLEKIRSTAVDGVRKRVQEIKLFVSWNRGFLRRKAEVYKKFGEVTAIRHNYGAFVVNYDNMFDICMVGSQVLFVFFLFLQLFRIG